MKARTAPWTTAVLATACAGLGAAVVFELTGGVPLAPEVTAAPPSTPQVDWSHEPVEFTPPSRDEIEEIAARPLFSPSRRPFVAPEEEEAPAPAQSLPEVQLIGVLMTEQQRAALVQDAEGGDPSWVREGTTVGGWRVERIDESRVHLRAGERLEVVELRPDTAIPAEARPKPRRSQAERREEERKAERREDREQASEEEDSARATESDPSESDEDQSDDAEERTN
jgi:Tfp pilus assembly protein PilP